MWTRFCFIRGRWLIRRVLQRHSEFGSEGGFALTPTEPLGELAYYRGRVDSILIWTGEPDGGNGNLTGAR